MATAHPQQDPDGTVYNLAASYGKTCKYHVVKIPPAQQGKFVAVLTRICCFSFKYVYYSDNAICIYS